jgi:hypothetical protein
VSKLSEERRGLNPRARTNVSTLAEGLSGRLLPYGGIPVRTTGSGSKAAHDSLLEIGGDIRVSRNTFFETKRSTTLKVASGLHVVRLRRTLRENGGGSNTHEKLLSMLKCAFQLQV